MTNADRIRGMSDEELAKFQASSEKHFGVTLDRLRELADADKDGRLVVLPCKVGDDVFSFRWSIKTQKYEVCAGKIKNVRYDTADCLVTVSDGERYYVWGKRAFPTREAAEAALKAGDRP